MISSKNFEFSFSGLKTAVLYKLQQLQPITYNLKADIAASTQQAIVDVLIAKLEKAILHFKPKTIMLGGGVAANALLRKKFMLLATKHRLIYSIPKLEYCTDNAAMVGVAAFFRVKYGKISSKNFSVNPNLMLK